MSVRASTSLPSSCSGAMYWNVPRIVPAAVRFDPCGVVICIESPDTTPDCGSESFASPKSRSLTPLFVSMTFAGLRSR